MAFCESYENLPMQYRKLFSEAKIEKFIGKSLTVLIFLLKTLIAGTRYNRRTNRLGDAVLTNTNNLCFGSKTRKIVNPSFFYTKRWCLRGYTFHGHVFLIKIHFSAPIMKTAMISFGYFSEVCLTKKK